MCQITKDIEIAIDGSRTGFRLTKLDAFSDITLLRLLMRVQERKESSALLDLICCQISFLLHKTSSLHVTVFVLLSLMKGAYQIAAPRGVSFMTDLIRSGSWNMAYRMLPGTSCKAYI